jgi:hypothetical protein
MVSLFAGAREEIMAHLVREERLLNETQDPLQALNAVERDGYTFSEWTIWKLCSLIGKTTNELTALRATNPDWNEWVTAANDLLFLLTEYAYYWEWKERYIAPLTPEPE